MSAALQMQMLASLSGHCQINEKTVIVNIMHLNDVYFIYIE